MPAAIQMRVFPETPTATEFMIALAKLVHEAASYQEKRFPGETLRRIKTSIVRCGVEVRSTDVSVLGVRLLPVLG